MARGAFLPGDGVTTFRPSLIIRSMSAILAAGFFFFAVALGYGFSLATDLSPAERWLIGLIEVGGAVAAAILFIRMAMTVLALRRSSIFVRNVFRSHVIPWTDIERFEMGTARSGGSEGRGAYYGIRVTLRSGKIVGIFAVQKSDLAVWLRRRTRADRVVDHLNDVLRDHRAMPAAPGDAAG